MKLSKTGIFGILSFLSYTAMVLFSPLAYPGYDWMTMAVSDLSAVGAPSERLACQLNALYSPCALVCAMGVCIAALILFIIGARKEGIKSLSIWAAICLVFMCGGAIGTGMLPKSVFGFFERFSLYSAVTFNAVLGLYLWKGEFSAENDRAK